jgi:hypothetical protein
LGGAKVDSLGGIGFFRPLLELLTTLDEYKIIGPKNQNFFSAAPLPGKRVNTFAAENSEP